MDKFRRLQRLAEAEAAKKREEEAKQEATAKAELDAPTQSHSEKAAAQAAIQLEEKVGKLETAINTLVRHSQQRGDAGKAQCAVIRNNH